MDIRGVCLLMLVAMSWFVFASCRDSGASLSVGVEVGKDNRKMSERSIRLKRENRTLTLHLADNAAVRELLKMVSEGPVTVQMREYGGFEMVGELPRALPTSDVPITTAVGDVMLYQGNQLTIFLKSNKWSYTRLGRIDSVTAGQLRTFFGGNEATVELLRVK